MAKMIIKSKHYAVEYDTKYGLKKYPFIINIYNYKFNDELIREIESSKVVTVDPDFCCYSQPSNSSTLYIVPLAMFDAAVFGKVIYNLLQKLDYKIESTE